MYCVLLACVCCVCVRRFVHVCVLGLCVVVGVLVRVFCVHLLVRLCVCGFVCAHVCWCVFACVFV